MAIVQLPLPIAANTGVTPNIKTMTTTDNLATITTAGYLNQYNLVGYPVSSTDILHVLYSFNQVTNSGTFGVFSVSISNGIITLAEDISGGNVRLPVTANHIAVFMDSTGKIKETENGDNVTIETFGNILVRAGTAGQGIVSMEAPTGTQGNFVLQPTPNLADVTFLLTHEAVTNDQIITLTSPNTGYGYIAMVPWDNITPPLTTGNLIKAQNTTGRIVDAGIAANTILASSITTPDTNVNLVSFDVTVTAAELAAGATKVLYASSGAKRYKIRAMWINAGGTNFSGGGGDRTFEITDGTTVYSAIPAASLTTIVNRDWEDVADFPFPAGSVPLNTSTAAGASLGIKYAGGTADYSAGSVVISGLLQRVA